MAKIKTSWQRKKDHPIIKAAMLLSKYDVQKSNQYLALLNQDEINNIQKKEMSLQIKNICNAVNEVKSQMRELDFELSYNHMFCQKTIHSLAVQYYVDRSTVTKADQKFLLKLSEYLYPEFHDLVSGA